jgi:phage repressor protein C with HTH and peptisase S24 domain
VVKQVDKEPGKLILRSFNPRYQPMEVPMTGDMLGVVRVIGRVIWWCHEAL